jgi:hypothetical protein
MAAPYLPDPDSTEALTGSKALAEILPPRSALYFSLSIAGLQLLSIMATVEISHVAIVRLENYNVLFLSGHLSFSYALFQVFIYSFHCRRSLLNENTTLIRFVNNRFSSGIDDEGTPRTVKCSYWSLIIAYAAANFLSMGLILVIYGLDYTLTGIFGPFPRMVFSVLNCVLYAVGCLLGTSQILNMRCTFMIIVCFGLATLAIFAKELIFTVSMLVLFGTSQSWVYRNYGYQETKPIFPASGTVTALPIVTCETGTGSPPATDALCKEVIATNGAASVSISTSCPSSDVAVWRKEFSANKRGDRSYKASEGAYSLLAADESVHGPGDDTRRQIL